MNLLHYKSSFGDSEVIKEKEMKGAEIDFLYAKIAIITIIAIFA